MLTAIIDTPYGVAGLIGNKLLEKYQRPVLVLKDVGKKYAGSNATAIANVVFFNSLIVHNKLPVLFSGNIISMQKYKRFLMPFFITH